MLDFMKKIIFYFCLFLSSKILCTNYPGSGTDKPLEIYTNRVTLYGGDDVGLTSTGAVFADSHTLGLVWFPGGIDVQAGSGSDVFFASPFPVGKSIALNDSDLLLLLEDFHLSSSVNLLRSGTIKTKNGSIILNGTFNLMDNRITFVNAATPRFDGNGNILDFSNGGQILVQSPTELNFNNVYLKGLRNESIAFEDSYLWEQGDFVFGTSNLYSVATDGTSWVVVGATGKLATTTDPAGTWILHADSSFGADNIYTITYANGIWLAGGTNGKIATATNPASTWTQRTSGFGTSSIARTAYGGTYWVIVGQDGKLATATDPTGTWTLHSDSSFGADYIKGVAFGNGVWVIVGGNGKLATATDPTGTWTQRTSGFGTSTIWNVIYGNNLWVAVGDSGKLIYATDPTVAWTLRTDTIFDSNNIYAIEYAKDLWIAGDSSGSLAETKDPTGLWSHKDAEFYGTIIFDMTYSGDKGVIAGYSGKIASGTFETQSTITFTRSTIQLCGNVCFNHDVVVKCGELFITGTGYTVCFNKELWVNNGATLKMDYGTTFSLGYHGYIRTSGTGTFHFNGCDIEIGDNYGSGSEINNGFNLKNGQAIFQNRVRISDDSNHKHFIIGENSYARVLSMANVVLDGTTTFSIL